MKVSVSKILNERIVETLKPSVNSVFQDGLLKISNFKSIILDFLMKEYENC